MLDILGQCLMNFSSIRPLCNFCECNSERNTKNKILSLFHMQYTWQEGDIHLPHVPFYRHCTISSTNIPRLFIYNTHEKKVIFIFHIPFTYIAESHLLIYKLFFICTSDSILLTQLNVRNILQNEDFAFWYNLGILNVRNINRNIRSDHGHECCYLIFMNASKWRECKHKFDDWGMGAHLSWSLVICSL